MSVIDFIIPQWPVSSRVRAVSTLRSGGVSAAPYDTLNLGEHVGDEVDAVQENRRRLCEQLGLAEQPYWLNQVHGAQVVRAGAGGEFPRADAAVADEPDRVCVVTTADCLPVLLARIDGKRVAAAHCGWRGLAAGVLEATLAALDTAPRQLAAWLGPAIGPAHFEVGPELRDAFEDHLDETRNHVRRVEEVFRMHGEKPKAIDCPAIDGIIKEADDVTGDIEDHDVLDAALIAAAQAVEHYEMTRYGTLVAWAKQLGRDDCAEVLAENLDEEKGADMTLSDIAERVIAVFATPTVLDKGVAVPVQSARAP